VNPDKALTHALNLRLGVRYRGTLAEGTVGPAQSLAVRFEATPRFPPRGRSSSPSATGSR
jgi:hypothetical protein